MCQGWIRLPNTEYFHCNKCFFGGIIEDYVKTRDTAVPRSVHLCTRAKPLRQRILFPALGTCVLWQRSSEKDVCVPPGPSLLRSSMLKSAEWNPKQSEHWHGPRGTWKRTSLTNLVSSVAGLGCSEGVWGRGGRKRGVWGGGGGRSDPRWGWKNWPCTSTRASWETPGCCLYLPHIVSGP